MKQFTKKIMGLFLIAILIIGLLPTASFAVDAAVAKSATIYISGDDAYRLYINGVKQGEDWQDSNLPDARKWSSIETYNVTLPDDFVIAIEAADLFGSIAGVTVKVVITGGPTFDITDPVWKVSTAVNSNWKTEKFYATGDNWTNVSLVTPHQSWPAASAWGWTKNAVASNMDKTTFFKYYVPKPVVPVVLEGTVNVYHYVIGTTTSLGTVPALKGTYESTYQTAPIVISNYTVTTPTNASGKFSATPTEVIYYYTPVVIPTETNPTETNPTETNPPESSEPISTEPVSTEPISTEPVSTEPITTEPEETETVITQIETTQPETTQTEEVVIIQDESVALGEITYINFDAFLPWETPPVDSVEEEVVLDEATPLADALPQTGQLPAGLFVGLGGLISAAGVFLKRK